VPLGPTAKESANNYQYSDEKTMSISTKAVIVNGLTVEYGDIALAIATQLVARTEAVGREESINELMGNLGFIMGGIFAASHHGSTEIALNLIPRLAESIYSGAHEFREHHKAGLK
jgi:hypothetical protein